MKTFLSSTFIDLEEHRRAVIDAIGRMGDQALNMEVYGARPEEPTAACLRDIDECHLFVGVYAHRYGHVPSSQDWSITESEYHHAKNLGKHLFCFTVDEDHPWPPKFVEGGPGGEKLVRFKAEIRESLVTDTFTSPENLGAKVASSLGRFWRSKVGARVEAGHLEVMLASLAQQLGPFRHSNDGELAIFDSALKKDVVFLLEAILTCHKSYIAYSKVRTETAFADWGRRVNELVQIIDCLRLSMATHWPSVFSAVHEYAALEALPMEEELARLKIAGAMRSLFSNQASEVLAEMIPLIDSDDNRVISLLRHSSLMDPNTGALRKRDSDFGDPEDVALLAAVRRLKEVLRTIMTPSEIRSAQEAYSIAYSTKS